MGSTDVAKITDCSNGTKIQNCLVEVSTMDRSGEAEVAWLGLKLGTPDLLNEAETPDLLVVAEI